MKRTGIPMDRIAMLKSNYEEVVRVCDLVDQIFLDRIRAKNPRYSLNQVKDLQLVDRFLSPKETIDLGLADEIV